MTWNRFFQLNAFILFVVVVVTLMTIPLHHDYYVYTEAWKSVISLGIVNPEIGGAYGPLFYFFAYPYSILETFPRVIFFIMAFLSMLQLSKYSTGSNKLWYLILLACPLFMIFSIKYGNNDTLLAGLTLFSFLAFDKQKYRTSAISIALAGCLKFLPLFLVPVLLINLEYKKRLYYAINLVACMLIIYLLAMFIFKYDPLSPVRFGVERDAKMYSIFRFFSGRDAFISSLGNYSIYAMTVGIFMISGFTYLKKWKWYLAAGIAYTWILMTYQVLHHQYFIPYYFLLAFIFVKEGFALRKWVIAAVLHFLWLNISVLHYVSYNNWWGEYEWIRSWLGLPTFIIQACLFYLLISTANKSVKNNFSAL